jgi:hypothetical protein
MSSVARAVSCASSLTSSATTAKPLPASPARAASIVALSASRLVCSAIDGDRLDDVADLRRRLAELATVVFVTAASVTASLATCAASFALRAISWIEEPISSPAAETVWTLRDTSSRGLRDGLRLLDACSADDAICDETCAISSDAAGERQRGPVDRRHRARGG